MITIDVDVQRVRATAVPRTIAAVVEVAGNELEFLPLGPSAASELVTEFSTTSELTQISEAGREIPIFDDEWTAEKEQRFALLAEREALGKLNPSENEELEALSVARRALKNPRSGGELIWEYEQRKITRDLVDALTRYVTFHKRSRRSSGA